MAVITIVDAEKLQRSCDVLLRELGLGLERALIGFGDVKAAAEPFRGRLRALEREADRIGQGASPLKPVVKSLLAETRRRFEELVERALRAQTQRGQVEGRFQNQYNQVVGQALADLPQQGTAVLRQQIEKRVGDVLDQVFPEGKVPGDVRAAMSRELTKWIADQPLVEDAFFLAQKVIVDVAGFLQQRLTIHGELVALRDTVSRRDALTPGDAAAADARAGQLAQRAVQLDEQIERAVRQTGLQVQGIVRLNPQLVLDPTKRFLSRLDAQAGIKIRRDQVTVELGTRLSVTNPLLLNGQTGVNVQPYLGVNIGPNFQAGASYENSFQGGQWKGGEVKASLTWRF